MGEDIYPPLFSIKGVIEMRRFELVFLIAILLMSITYSEDWNYYILPDGSTDTTSLKIDSNDNPHILYCKNGVLKYAFYDGNEWTFENISGNGFYGGYLTLDVDDINNPHISFFEWNSADLMYGYNNGGEWIIEIVDSEDEAGFHNSICLDSNNRPHIAYTHFIETPDREEHLKYAKFDGDNWSIEVVDDEYQYQGDVCSIAIDSDNISHIVYNKEIYHINHVFYAYRNGTEWLIEDVYELGDYAWETSIAIDSDDNPHITFTRGGISLYYAKKENDSWVVDEIDTDAGGVSIVIDDNDYPQIAYSYDIPYHKPGIKYARWNGSAWEFEIAYEDDGVGLGTGYVSHDIDSDGNPHISCDEWLNWDTWYIWYGDPMPAINLTTFSAVAKGDSAILLNWSVETTEGEVIEGFNLYRREMVLTHSINHQPGSEDTYPRWTKINEHLITGQNPYTYIDDTVESGITYEYKLEAIVENSTETLGTTQGTCGLPTSFSITSIHPNPATDIASITLTTPQPTDIVIEVYDITGRRVLVEEVGLVESGEYTHSIDSSGLSSGVYSISAIAGGETDTGRMVVVR
jgi:hypothetical protein